MTAQKRPGGFTTSFVVNRSPTAVFDAINDVPSWWGPIEGRATEVGGAFTYRHHDMHRSVQTVSELVPGKRVVWEVTDAQLNFVEDKREWVGTRIVFELTTDGASTEVRFTHVGLEPGLECYEACSTAWAFYVADSLRKRILTLRGEPDPS